MIGPDEVLAFWLDEKGPEKWYVSEEALDAEIREKFGDAWQNARDGAYSMWLTYPNGSLAYIILTDQFSRNMFRNDGQAFATDRAALAAAKSAIAKGWDKRIDAPARQFFYLPLMHSENLSDQDRCVRLMCERMPDHGGSNLLHAKAHREVIREFGRFTYRNDALGRATNAQEVKFLANGGYGSIVRSLQSSAQAA